MSTTSKGVPFPALDGSTDNDIPADLKALADWIDANPGIAVVTTTARDALTGADLWNGRVVLNTTTGQLNKYVTGSSSWVVVGVGDHGELLGLADDDHPQYLTGARHDARDHAFVLATTGTPAAPGFTGSLGAATKAARADHVHPIGVSEIAASSAPTSWPAGVSVMQVSATAGWPFTYGTVLTFRSDSGDRVAQIAVEKSTAATFTRASASSSTWGAWAETVHDTDPRLSDARTPTAHTHAAADIVSGILALARIPVAASGASSATQVVRADDSRLSNARTPTAHTHTAADIISGVLAVARLGSGTPAAGKYVDGTGVWKPLTDTPGALLARNAYTPPSPTDYQTTSGTLVDIDATNAAVTFTAPSTGLVLVRITAVSGYTGTTNPRLFGIREGSTIRGQEHVISGGAGSADIRLSAEFIFGETPGTVHTYKFAHGIGGTSGTSMVRAGYGSVGAPWFGPITMEVYSA